MKKRKKGKYKSNILAGVDLGTIFFPIAVVDVLFVISIAVVWANSEKENMTGFIILEMILIAIGLYLFFAGLYTRNFQVEIKDSFFIYRNLLKKEKEFAYTEISRAVKRKTGTLKLYSDRKCILTVSGDIESSSLEDKLVENGVKINREIEDFDNFIISPYRCFSIFFFIFAAVFAIVIFYFIITGQNYLFGHILFSGLILYLLYQSLSYWCDSLEVRGDVIIKRGFLKKTKTVNIRDIAYMEEVPMEPWYKIIVYIKNSEEKIEVPGYYKGIEVFIIKMANAHIKWKKK